MSSQSTHMRTQLTGNASPDKRPFQLIISPQTQTGGQLTAEEGPIALVSHYRQEAEKGDANAARAIATILEEGKILKANPEAAEKWHRRAEKIDAHQGDLVAIRKLFPHPRISQKTPAESHFHLGDNHVRGFTVEDHVELKIEGDVIEGLYHLQQASEMGHMHATATIGSLYFSGGSVVQNLPLAAKFYAESAGGGDRAPKSEDKHASVLGECGYGKMCYLGLGGLPQDREKGKMYVGFAAHKSYSPAIVYLNEIRQIGEGKEMGPLLTDLKRRHVNARTKPEA